MSLMLMQACDLDSFSGFGLILDDHVLLPYDYGVVVVCQLVLLWVEGEQRGRGSSSVTV